LDGRADPRLAAIRQRELRSRRGRTRWSLAFIAGIRKQAIYTHGHGLAAAPSSMVGILPRPGGEAVAPGRAFSQTSTTTAGLDQTRDEEAVMVMTEIRPALNQEAPPGKVHCPASRGRTIKSTTGHDDGRRPSVTMPGLRGMPLRAVAAACREEMGKRRRGEPFTDAFGEELFRRAICQRDHGAWEAIVDQYRALLTSWVRRHPAYVAGCVDSEDVAIRALARFWMAVGPERLAQFAGINPVMQYLKMCVHSIVLNEARTLGDPSDPPEEEHDIEALALDQVAASQLWRSIMRVLDDRGERLVVYLAFALGMKPAAIHARHPDRFCCVGEVYQLKRNAIERLRRSPEILRFQMAA
jgi:hypothetical protein